MAKSAISSVIIYQAEATLNVTNALNDMETTKIDLGYSIRDLYVMRIKKIDYYVARGNGMVAAFGASGDELAFGLSQDPRASTSGGSYPGPGDLGMLDFNKITRFDTGAAGNATLLHDPFVSKLKTDVYPEGQLCHPASYMHFFIL